MLCNSLLTLQIKNILMKIYTFLFFAVASVFISCKEEETVKPQTTELESQKAEQIFDKINKAWVFTTPQPNASLQKRIQNWAEWRLFVTELNQKPKSSIGAFKQKSRTLAIKATELQNNIPASFDKPEIVSRIMTLTTKIKALELYLNLSYIQEAKVIKLIPEINEELISLQSQMEEIIKKSEIRYEEGEAEMLQKISDSVKKPEAVLLPMNLQHEKPKGKPFK